MFTTLVSPPPRDHPRSDPAAFPFGPKSAQTMRVLRLKAPLGNHSSPAVPWRSNLNARSISTNLLMRTTTIIRGRDRIRVADTCRMFAAALSYAERTIREPRFFSGMIAAGIEGGLTMRATISAIVARPLGGAMRTLARDTRVVFKWSQRRKSTITAFCACVMPPGEGWRTDDHLR
jgi:hypothetical protein